MPRRIATLIVRLSEQEKAAMAGAASWRGMTHSEFVRNAVRDAVARARVEWREERAAPTFAAPEA